MRRKGRVVAAAMFRMQNKREVKNPRFKLSILAVWTENMEDVLGSGQLRHGAVDIKTIAVMIMTVGLIAVNAEHRKQCDEL